MGGGCIKGVGADAATIAFRGMWNVGNSVREGEGEADLDGNLKLIPTQDPAGAESGRCQDGEYVVGVSTFCFLSLAARRVASAQNGMG